MQPLTIVKISGNVIDNKEALADFLHNFAAIQGHKILVHGGGKLATQIGNDLGIESKYIDGRRITDAQTIDVVTMVYAGLINKQIVAQLQARGCNAVGLSGADGNIIPAVKRPVNIIDYGFVGDVQTDKINVALIDSLLQTDCTIVLAPITHNNEGQLLNTNADTIAQSIAVAMSATYNTVLIYCFEKNGVLLDINNEDSVIAHLTYDKYVPLKEKDSNGNAVIFEGMIPKLDNAFAATKHGVAKVIIGKAADLQQLIAGKKGTTIQYA